MSQRILAAWLFVGFGWGAIGLETAVFAEGDANAFQSADHSSAGSMPAITRVSSENVKLPSDAGQYWQTYDISPYTSRIKDTERPEQAIIDWIMRETGEELWFSEPFGILSASKNSLRVYHTPEIQRLVLDIVDRFVKSEGESHQLALRLVTINNPNWRAVALPLMQAIDVHSSGIDAWLLSKENAAVVMGQLRNRVDFREHNSPNLLIQNGQSFAVSRLRPKNFVRSVRIRREVWPGHELMMGQLQEGYTLEISPLMSLDNSVIDAVIQCEIDQIEKLVPVNVDVPSVAGGTQRVQIQVPQLVSWRLHERFRWPANQVLLLSCGVVATPSPNTASTLPLGIPNPMTLIGSGRADALLFIESKGKASESLLEAQRAAGDATPNYRGRY